jgi:hypothetical protein
VLLVLWSAGLAVADGVLTAPGLADYLRQTDADITRITNDCAPLPRQPIGFGANLVLAHGGTIGRYDLDVLQPYVAALKAAGAQRLEFNPTVRPRAEPRTARKYQALVAEIRRLGLTLAINPEAPMGANSTFGSFEEYQQAALTAYAQWAAQLQPDIFVLVHEPVTMSNRLHVKTTPAQWRAFIAATARVVKQASPQARLGAGCFAGLSDREVPFFEAFATMPEIDVLTVDNYVGSREAEERMDQMVKVAREARKPLYMEETWRPHFVEPGAHHAQGDSMESISAIGYGWSGFQALDARWLGVMALYCASHGLESMTAFQTRCFFHYVDAKPTDGAGYDQQVAQAIGSGQHTATWDAFLGLTRQFGRP